MGVRHGGCGVLSYGGGGLGGTLTFGGPSAGRVLGGMEVPFVGGPGMWSGAEIRGAGAASPAF